MAPMTWDELVEEQRLKMLETKFGVFADKVMQEFRLCLLARKAFYEIKAKVNVGKAEQFEFLYDLANSANLDREVEVIFNLRYKFHDKMKYIAFSQSFSLETIANKINDKLLIEKPEELIVGVGKLRLEQSNYNFGNQANGDEFDGEKFVRKIFVKCDRDARAIKPSCAVEDNGGRSLKR